MVFHSYIFILGFLPVTLLGFVAIKRTLGGRSAIGWLVLCSLAFYGWWEPKYLLLIGVSITGNYLLGRWMDHQPPAARRKRQGLLILGVALNLGLLAYFKYAHFLTHTANTVFGADWHLDKIVLPLAISFFTFQQIAYLADVFQGLAHERSFLRYALFVSFFPQLIAGPIVHHGAVLPQIERSVRRPLRSDDLAIGVTIFAFGVAKKVLVADGVAQWASPVFDMAAAGQPITFLEAWAAVFAYGFQIYFDFSGYSDMAIGLGRCFGIRLPLNFHSPYKAVNIIDFWRRWHITLSTFLRDYLYIPLGGNQKGKPRRYTNLIITMLLGGLWHGAGWQFVVWGGLHGLYLVINHAAHAVRRLLGLPHHRADPWWAKALGVGITFLAVNLAWVFFRADNFDTAWRMLQTMAGLDGLDWTNRVRAKNGELWAVGMLAMVWLLPNTQQVMGRFRPAKDYRYHPSGSAWWQWKPTALWAWVTLLLLLYALLQIGSGASEFIYYRF